MNIKNIIFLLTGIWAFAIGSRLVYELMKGDFLVLSCPLSFILDWVPLMLLGALSVGIILYEDNTSEVRRKLNGKY